MEILVYLSSHIKDWPWDHTLSLCVRIQGKSLHSKLYSALICSGILHIDEVLLYKKGGEGSIGPQGGGQVPLFTSKREKKNKKNEVLLYKKVQYKSMI